MPVACAWMAESLLLLKIPDEESNCYSGAFAQGADIMSWSEPRVEPGWLSTLLLSVGAAVGVGLPLFIVIVWMFLAR